MAIEKELVDQLLANYEKPEDLTGKDGLLRQLTKELLTTDCQHIIPNLLLYHIHHHQIFLFHYHLLDALRFDSVYILHFQSYGNLHNSLFHLDFSDVLFSSVSSYLQLHVEFLDILPYPYPQGLLRRFPQGVPGPVLEPAFSPRLALSVSST